MVEAIPDLDQLEHMNLVFLGLEGHGKSTLAATMLVQLGFVSLDEIQAIDNPYQVPVQTTHPLLFDYLKEE